MSGPEILGLPPRQPRFNSILHGELLVSLLLIAITATYASMYFYEMATTSLWNDELYTISHFSSRGIITSASDYHVANNHIFFNVLNAITPYSDSYEPARARLWSFLFLISAALIILVYHFRKKKYLEGSVLLFAMLANPGILDLGLQARGYGFLFFSALSTSLLHVAYIQSEKLKYLILIGGLTVLGTWTIPTYLFFSAPLMLVTFLYKRTPAVFLVGVGTVVCIAALHIPVFTDMLHHVNNYGDKWGKQYATIGSITKTYQTYLFVPGTRDWLIVLFLFAALAFPAIVHNATTKKDRLVALASQHISISIVLFFTVCLYLETPIIRTTSFIVIPTFILFITMLGHLYRNKVAQYFKPLIYIPITIGLGYVGYGNIKSFSFTPIENWKGVAEFIENTLPVDMRIAAIFRSGQLDMYLSDDYEIVKNFSSLSFLQGKEAVVDGDFFKGKTERFTATDFSALAAEIKIPQRRGGYQTIAFMPNSSESYLQEISINGKQCACNEMFDRNNDTRWTTGKPQSNLTANLTLRFTLAPNREYKSFIMISRNGDVPFNYSVYAIKRGTKNKVDSNKILTQGDQMIISLTNQSIDSLELIIHQHQTDRFFSINEVWLYVRIPANVNTDSRSS